MYTEKEQQTNYLCSLAKCKNLDTLGKRDAIITLHLHPRCLQLRHHRPLPRQYLSTP